MYSNNEKNLLDFFLSRTSLFSLSIVFALLFFHTPLLNWFDKNIVTGLLDQIKGHSSLDIVFILIMHVSVLVCAIHLREARKISNFSFAIIVCVTICYLYFREFSNRYNIVALDNFPELKYLDILILILIYCVILKLKELLTEFYEPSYHQVPFIVDKPIGKEEEDFIGRHHFAKKIAERIQSKIEIEGAGALAIGINGVWGSGKTSFTNLIKSNLAVENRIIIDFNPWRSSSAEKIIEDFFELLVSEVSSFDNNLSNNISSYAKTLTSIDENLITKGISTVSNFLFPEKNKNEIFYDIDVSIQKIKKQLIIFIDDLDRLDKKEIIEVLRIIRNTANFNHIAYIVSYDRNYVVEAIKEFNSHKPESFLEKIFQFEFVLPKYDSGIHRTQIKTILKDKLYPSLHILVDAAVDARSTKGKNFTNEVIKTQRDVIRFCNAILFEFDVIEEEVYFVDFYYIQLLKLKYRPIYELLFEYKEIFFKEDKTSSGTKFIRLRKASENNINDDMSDLLKLFQDERKETTDDLEIFVDFMRNKSSDHLTSFDKELIIELINELLKDKSNQDHSSSNITYNSFYYPENFNKYFTLGLLQTDIPTIKFERLRKGTYEEYKAEILEWIDKGKLSEVMDWLEKIKFFNSFQEYKNHILILFELGRQHIEKVGIYGFNYNYILNVINYSKDSSSNLQEQGKSADFIRELFEEPAFPYVFESTLLATMLSTYRFFPFEDGKAVENRILDLFKKYCKEEKSITHQFRLLYNNCIQHSEISGSEPKAIPEATVLFKEHFKNYLKSCDLGGFIQHAFPREERYYLHQVWLLNFFDSIEDFENFLITTGSIDRTDECYKEFVNFYWLVKENDFESVIFNFKFLEPNKIVVHPKLSRFL